MKIEETVVVIVLNRAEMTQFKNELTLLMGEHGDLLDFKNRSDVDISITQTVYEDLYRRISD